MSSILSVNRSMLTLIIIPILFSLATLSAKGSHESVEHILQVREGEIEGDRCAVWHFSGEREVWNCA